MSSHPQLRPSDPDLVTLFDRYAGYIAQAGKHVRRASPAEAERIFAALDSAHRQQVIARLGSQISIFEELVAAGERLTDSPRLLWRSLIKSGLRPCSDVFDKIGDTDIVEVYGNTQTHICQNLNFFDWISLTLERIFCESWYEAMARDKTVELQLHGIVGRLFAGEFTGTVCPEVPWHRVEELDSELLYRFELRTKWVSPVYSDNRIAGFIAVNECRNLVSGGNRA